MEIKFSVIIPAHNEENWIGKCLASIEEARKQVSQPVEVIVSLNRCSDKTEDICRSYGAKVVFESEKNLSKIRNKAAHEASGEIVVTIDADSTWAPICYLK